MQPEMTPEDIASLAVILSAIRQELSVMDERPTRIHVPAALADAYHDFLRMQLNPAGWEAPLRLFGLEVVIDMDVEDWKFYREV